MKMYPASHRHRVLRARRRYWFEWALLGGLVVAGVLWTRWPG